MAIFVRFAYILRVVTFALVNRKLYILFFLLMLAVLSSCTVKQKLALADRAYDQQAYARSDKRYGKVQSKLSRSKDPDTYYKVLFRMAEISRLTGNTRKAEGLYERSILKSNPNPNAILGLAKSQQMNEKFAEAANNYAEYLKFVPQDSAIKSAVNFCIALRDSTIKKTRYLVEPVPDFNSNKDDFAPAFAEDDYSVVYFTSSRDAATGRKRRKSIVTGDKKTDIFFAKQARNGRWENERPVEGEINTKNDEGVSTFSRNLRKMYFTQCITKGATPGCKICSATRSEENIWTEVEELDLADSMANAAHPSLSEDETVLYFTSDMAGGFGGFDIWMVNRLSADEGWSEPINLGKDINSEGDELYPYMRHNGVLYFSSSGKDGYGGLDIFKATKKQEGGWHVENMGMPINSAADDFSIIFEREGEAGYFASRRRVPKVKGGDDIFRFVLPEAKFMFVGSVREADEDTPMDQANVSVITSGGESTRHNTERDGIFTLQLQPETDYLVRVSKSGYFNQKARFSTKGLEDITTLRDEFLMRSMAKAVELENILYDFGKYTLRPESEESLNGLVEVLNDNPSISIEIASHSDSRGDSTFNVELSQKRAQSVVDYLVKKGVDASRLEAKGYGASKPRTVSKSVAVQYKFLREGDVLSDDFLRKNIRTQEEEDIVDQLNRRTEFQVVSGVQ